MASPENTCTSNIQTKQVVFTFLGEEIYTYIYDENKRDHELEFEIKQEMTYGRV